MSNGTTTLVAAGVLLAVLTGGRQLTSRSPAAPRDPLLASLAVPSSTPANRPAEEPIGFATHVLPILTKAGCNSGACHGAATGQGGFRLSLLGYDPQQDFLNITREQSGRRIDLVSPVDSLLLRKPDRGLPHKGGMKLESGSADHAAIAAWIAGGASFGPPDLRVAAIDVSPADVLLMSTDQSVQLKVQATLSDGRVLAVTNHALYAPNDPAIAEASVGGKISVRRRGTTAVMVRFGGQVAAVRVGVPRRDAPLAAADIDFEPRNYIDQAVLSELQRQRVPPSPLADDAQFLRRIHLDLIGRLPTPSEVRAFVAQPSTPASRRKVIADLLAQPEMPDLWTLRLADLLQVDSKRLGDVPARTYHQWLREQVATNTPFDRVVRELLTAEGDMATVGPANFHRIARDPRDTAEAVAGTLLGVRIACARCHAHPVAAWTQDDYYGFAAFFARTEQAGNRVTAIDRGEVLHPKTNKPVAARLLGAAASLTDAPGIDRRVALADWVVSPGNPMLARVTVNRVWRHMTGRGLVEPVDDLRPTNPPSNPALLDALAADFIANGYDVRRLIQTIAESRTYQASSISTDANRDDDRLHSHAFVRPLAPQVMADAISQATGVPDDYPGHAAGTRAVQLIDARTPSETLDVLGRCTRETGCDQESAGGGLSQALHLINGKSINGKLKGGSIEGLIKASTAVEPVIDELFLRTLSRFPTKNEKDYCLKKFAEAAGRREAAEDLLWVLLNTREFGFNH
ncbi:DUF1549 and DUF1553 domain-containing protein [Humisphaera borealis]|uniref:DUF1553 domain-containing protein n=1 Tax=Humisphaera borealis TaxID=2807512 RepID=A0A7M2WYL4_9BACT|nr:DUF1549 and DUF1553 domain-containing protein [Humisphaera borealis]QOV90588.1 DUF1553 domain-containing protein [Humisphaera borealis]